MKNKYQHFGSQEMSNNNLHIDGCVVMQESPVKTESKKKIQSFMTCKEITAFSIKIKIT